jgi:hypothetical protein
VIAAIMPCKGRAEQTVRNVQRLLATAHKHHARTWQLYCVMADDDDTPAIELSQHCIAMQVATDRLTYWQALTYATERTDADLIVNLANDLWACDGWLATAEAEYRHHFGDGPGLLGFAGDGHGPEHSCHFLISRTLLDRYGGWPTHYQHNFGDTELCARARADGVYWKSAEATLEHCHVERGLAEDDAVYAAGRATYQRDAALFTERRAQGWPLTAEK